MGDRATAWLDLFWLPLGAGGHFVRWNGRAYEWLTARPERRAPLDLYHCALMVRSDDVTYAVEMGPVWNVTTDDRGVVCRGPVGMRWLSRFGAFRYEVRCWPGGHIPAVEYAIESPVRVTTDRDQVAAVLTALHDLPALTWGRDELGTGEMWNSNSVVAYALARSARDLGLLHPPAGGRAPGWRAGLWLAACQNGRRHAHADERAWTGPAVRA